MQLKKINNTLKKSCVVMTKIHNGSIINAALAKKSHLRCYFIILILTRTGLHTNWHRKLPLTDMNKVPFVIIVPSDFLASPWGEAL